jgi:hypothetical protein
VDSSVLTFNIDNHPGWGPGTQRSGVHGSAAVEPATGQWHGGWDLRRPYAVTDVANAALAAGSTSVKVTGLSIAAGASCTITVNVTNKPGQTNPSCTPTVDAFTNDGTVTQHVGDHRADQWHPSRAA